MVRWLVIGIGDVTRKRVIPAILAEPRSFLYGVVTRNPEKAQAYAGAEVFTSLDEALKDCSVDAVYVASPVAMHAEQTIAALNAGKHVLCEKPVAMDYAQARSMAAAGEASGKLLGISFYRRLYPKLIRAKQLIEQGAIGKPVVAEAACHSWFDDQERGWRSDPKLAGCGPLFDTASHRIDAFNFLFGKPKRAKALTSNAVHDLPVEDSATVLVEYESGPRAIVDVSWSSHIARDEFRIIGTEGELSLTPLNGPLLRYGDTVETLPSHTNVHYPLVENFVSAVLNGSPLACTGAQAIVTDWVTESSRA